MAPPKLKPALVIVPAAGVVLQFPAVWFAQFVEIDVYQLSAAPRVARDRAARVARAGRDRPARVVRPARRRDRAARRAGAGRARDRPARERRVDAGRRGDAGDVDPGSGAGPARDGDLGTVDRGAARVLHLYGERLDLGGRVPGACREVECLREVRRVGDRNVLRDGRRVEVVRARDRRRADEVLIAEAGRGQRDEGLRTLRGPR